MRPLLIAALAALMLGLAGVAAGAVLGGGGDADRGADADVAAERFRGNEPPAVFDAADFALREALSGGLVRMVDQRGRVVVLTFLESRCTTACPVIASQVAEALRRLPSEDRSNVVWLLWLSAQTPATTRAGV